MPFNIKILIIFLYSSSLFGGGFYIGKQLEKGKQAKKENILIEKEVTRHNEQQQKLGTVVKEIEKIKIEYRDKIIQLPPINIDDRCPIDDITRLRNDAYKTLDPALFTSND